LQISFTDELRTQHTELEDFAEKIKMHINWTFCVQTNLFNKCNS